MFCRFSPEMKATRPNLAYLPFGTGPRMCIGNRFALTVAKITIIRILLRYKIVLSPNMAVPVVENVSRIKGPRDGVQVILYPR